MKRIQMHLKQDLIYANNAVVKINNANIIEEVTPIFFKKFDRIILE